jgi:predicted nucleic acid-binding protein
VIGAILDTDVFSIIIEERPRAEKFSSLVLGVETALAFPSVAELTHGAHRAGWGAARREWLEAHIARHGLLVPTEDLLRLWGVLRAQAGWLGHPLGQQLHSNDLWIAACAVFYRVPLVTGNERHFVGLPGLELVG